jgi:hypothetical protein
MPESNGSGRLDRIEAILEKIGDRLNNMTTKLEGVATMGYLHDERIAHIEANIEQMQEDEKAYRAAQRASDEASGQRIDKLVSAIGELIRR